MATLLRNWIGFALTFLNPAHEGKKRIPRLDFSRFSDSQLADLNLPPEVRTRFEVERSQSRRSGLPQS